MHSRRQMTWLAGIFLAAGASLFAGRQAVASWCNCPDTKATHYELTYSGITMTCSTTQTGTASGTGGAPGGGSGGGSVGGSGTSSAVCWVSYTVVDPHDVGGGGYNPHTQTPKDGTYAITTYTGGGCIQNGILWWISYTCSDLTGSTTHPDNYPTQDCQPD
jgi:hypothetical protein